MNDIYIVDAVGFLFRSYYAIRGMSTPSGESTNALFGFIRSIQKIQKDFSPTHLCAVFDGPNNKASRTALYEDYKANRSGMPEDLVPQLTWAIEFCEASGIPLLSIPNVEADDTIGSIATWANKRNTHVHICSSDKDLCQLIHDKIELIYTHKDNRRIGPDDVIDIYGVRPDQIRDYLAIVGDASDNIPGLEGLGPKSAAALLQEFGSLEAVLDNPDKVKGAKKQETIRNGREKALLSKKLATIDTTIDIPYKESFYEVDPQNIGKLAAFYNRFHFRTLLKELDSLHEKKPEPAKATHRTISNAEELTSFLASLKGSVCFDVETTGLDQMRSRLVGIGLGIDEPVYVPWNGSISEGELHSIFSDFFARKDLSFYGHNVKYDLHILRNHNISVASIDFDTMVASYLLAPHNNRHSLDDLTLAHFDVHKTPISSLIGTGKKEISMREVPIEDVSKYCCEDITYTIRLRELFEPELAAQGLDKPMKEFELPLIPVLLSMERHGIKLDVPQLEEKSKLLRHNLDLLQKEIFVLAGEEFNINSPKQLSSILFEKLEIPSPTKKMSTRADVLESLKSQYPIVAHILSYRVLEKLRSTYVDALPGQVNPETGCIHSSYNQTVTATGRLSSTNPNLQNIPIRTEEGRAIREAFVPKEAGNIFLAADYSQIELRLMAAFANEEALISAFAEGKDVHRAVAAEVFEVSEEDVTKQMRSQAKAVNFGIMYGQQAFGLSQQLGIEVKKAKIFIEKYFDEYPNVKSYIEKSIAEARERGYAYTIGGRRRPLPDIHSKNGMLRSQAERLAVNTPLQGSQADIIKMAMRELAEAKMNDFLVLQIHDELVFEIPETDAEPFQKKVIDIMEGVVSLKVPLEVNIAIGKNWGAC